VINTQPNRPTTAAACINRRRLQQCRRLQQPGRRDHNQSDKYTPQLEGALFAKKTPINSV
jgi:hypothetical protein